MTKPPGVTYLVGRQRILEREEILRFLADGPKTTEEIRHHMCWEYYRAGNMLRALRAEGKIQSARAPTQRANAQKRWRLTPVNAVDAPDSIRPDGGSQPD